tara:strand:+ start:29 stop:814 length:786 start_codon:yes stop_codon:yes gene_type:complete
MNPNISASKINLFNADIPMFVMNYGIGKRTESPPAAVRGIVIEDAVASVLQGRRSVDEAVIKSCERFVQVFYALQSDSFAQYKYLRPCIELACEALKDYGVPIFSPDGTQEKIEFILKHDNWKIPVVGFLDFVFPNGKIIDLKTTNRLVSVMSTGHQIQRAIYQTARPDHEVEFLYVTPKNFKFLSDGDVPSLMDEIKTTVKRMDTFCSLMTPQQAAMSIPINPDSFYWRDQYTLERIYNEQTKPKTKRKTKTKTLEKMEL